MEVDERFQLDERFKDAEFDDEFDKQEDVKAQRPAVKSFQRFDPDDPEHIAWMEANKNDVVNRKKAKTYDAETFNNEVDTSSQKVIEGQFYEVDRSFAKELREMLASKSSRPPEKFSFLSMIGRSDRPETPGGVYEAPKFKPKKLKRDEEQVYAVPGRSIEKPYFFIDTQEKQFKDVLASFSCQQSMDLVRKKWETDRAKIIKQYKNISKNALKEREREQQAQNRKRKTGQQPRGMERNKKQKIQKRTSAE